MMEAYASMLHALVTDHKVCRAHALHHETIACIIQYYAA